MKDYYKVKPIGQIHAPLKRGDKIPVQPQYSEIEGTIEIKKEYERALKDLEGFEYIYCIAYLHHIKDSIALRSPSHWDSKMHGIFALRTPRRPNPIALSILKLLNIKKNILKVKNLDLMDGTPVLDIKPFVPSNDNRETEKTGWIK